MSSYSVWNLAFVNWQKILQSNSIKWSPYPIMPVMGVVWWGWGRREAGGLEGCPGVQFNRHLEFGVQIQCYGTANEGMAQNFKHGLNCTPAFQDCRRWPCSPSGWGSWSSRQGTPRGCAWRGCGSRRLQWCYCRYCWKGLVAGFLRAGWQFDTLRNAAKSTDSNWKGSLYICIGPG